MQKKSNEIECPHCKEVLDISLFAKGELAQKLETEIERKLLWGIPMQILIGFAFNSTQNLKELGLHAFHK